jgi:cob(I)alamin adenosyltransferase
MPRINRVTTRRGDEGETSLGNHERVLKDAQRVQAYGTVDELNAVIGLALGFDLGGSLPRILRRVQNELLDVGADLAMPPRTDEDSARRVDSDDVVRLEADQSALRSNLEPLQNFVLPGGSPAVASLHLARTVCRRAEREVVTLARYEPMNREVLRYLNRLSDLLFIAARAQATGEAVSEPVWRPRASAKGDASTSFS